MDYIKEIGTIKQTFSQVTQNNTTKSKCSATKLMRLSESKQKLQ